MRDDTDLEWRLEAIGVKMKSIKYCANLFSLIIELDRKDEDEKNRLIIETKQEKMSIEARKGINQYVS